MADNRQNMRVVVRCRPFSIHEMEQNQRSIIKVLDSSTLMFDPEDDEDEFFFHGVQQTHRDITKKAKKKLSMDFDDVFDASAQNVDIFESCMKPVVQSVMDGYNCSVFVYGATGAGKTFTMLGSADCPGITYLTMKELFKQIDSLSETRKFDIGITYLEVYNELVMNLLKKGTPLQLREDGHGVVVSGLALKQISGADELLDLLASGNRNRTQHPTVANAESSRSHAIFQVHIRMTDKKTQIKRTVKLSMIDLAGSERAASTKCTGIRFKEGANINKSLLALGNCINKLAEGSKHIPYRDSNLTRILKDSLGGNCRTVMIANVSPSSLTYDDTYNTLKYASRAKKIKNVVKQNIVPTNVPKEFLLKKIGEQHELIEQLKAQKTALETKLGELESKPKQVSAINNFDTTIADSFNKKLTTIFEGLKKTQENYFRLKSKENILHLRIKLKEQIERLTKVFVLDGSQVDANLKRIEAAKDKYAKLAMSQKDTMDYWRSSYKEFRHELVILKNEIEKSPMASYVHLHLKSLESEFTAQASKIKNDHLMKIINLYRIESDIWKETMVLGGEIIQENYLLLKSMDCLDNVILEKMESLAKLHQAHHAVKFSDEDEKMDEGENNMLDINIETLFDLDNVFDEPKEIFASGIKRLLNNDESEDSDAVKQDVKRAKNDQNLAFVKPKTGSILKNAKSSDSKKFKVPTFVTTKAKRKLITEPTTISSDMSSGSEAEDSTKNMNDTFNIMDKKAGSSVNDILTSRNANALKVINPPSKDLVKKVKATINKENKRFSPKRIGKSPLLRSNSRATTATTIINKYRMKTVANGDPHSSGDGNRPLKVNGSKK